MPFRLKNAGAIYQRLMNKMFAHQIKSNVQVYVDDMLMKSLREDDHLDDLWETFDTLRSYNMKLNPNKYAFGVTAGKFLGFVVSQRGIEVNSEKIRAIMELEPSKTIKEVQSLNGKIAALNRFVSKATDKCLPFFRTLRKSFEWTDKCQKTFEELKKYLSSLPLLNPSKPGKTLPLLSNLVSSGQCGLCKKRRWVSKTRLLYKPGIPRRRKEVPPNGETSIYACNCGTKAQVVFLGAYNHNLDGSTLEKSHK